MKSTIRAAVANALSFAHLSSVKAAKSKADDEDKKDYPEDDDDKKDAKAEGDEPDDDDEDKKGAKAESDDPKDDDEDEEKKGAKSKAKSKAEEDEDDEHAEMHGSSAAAAARRRERARCAAIFASPAAARNVELAANLAFETRLTRAEALQLLEKTPGAARSQNAARSDLNPRIGANAAPPASQQQVIASRWDAAYTRATGRRNS